MCLAPTLGEVTVWLVTPLVTIILLARVLASSEGNGQIEDLAAWQRNYERMQRR